MRRESATFSIPGAEYFLHLCDTAGVALLSVDCDLTIRYCNQKTADLLGRRPECVVGASLKDVLGRRDGAMMENLARRAIQRGQCGATEFRWQSPDGGHPFLAATLSPIRDDGDRILGASVCFRDITHCIQIQDQLGEVRKMRALGTMAGKFAHHFNNILGSVVTSVDFAKECSDMRVMRKTMRSVARSLQRATTMLDELLAFAEADYRDTDLADLTETILQFADDIQPTLDEKNVEFELKLARVPVIEVPRNPFLTVLNNLAGNAVDAMMHGGRLSVELDADRDHVVCRIIDTGQASSVKIWSTFSSHFTAPRTRNSARESADTTDWASLWRWALCTKWAETLPFRPFRGARRRSKSNCRWTPRSRSCRSGRTTRSNSTAKPRTRAAGFSGRPESHSSNDSSRRDPQ